MTLPPLNIPQLLQKHHLKPKKHLGQNFLIDPHALDRVMQVAQVNANDEVLEIGSGLGSLTRLLANQTQHVTAVEIDADMIPILKEVLLPFNNVTLIHGDILKQNIAGIIHTDDYIVVANIPYYITSAVLRHLLEAHPKPRRMILTIQKEVATRICAKDGKMSLLSISVQIYGRPSIEARIPAGCFYPTPEVESSVIAIDLFPDPVIPSELLDQFFTLAHSGFGQKRKTLRNSLSAGLALAPEKVNQLLIDAGIEPQRRAETLSIKEWEVLTHGIAQMSLGQ
jgi:16S rRNA (adenine1518-N6/adenine1519-N6)-dimethyltransferase